MTNKKQLIAILTLATILITGGFSLTPLAYSTGSSNGNSNNNNYGNSNGHDDDDDDDKVKVCHIPQGNPGNAHIIKISQSAVAAHLGHGDTLGACPQDEDDDDDEDDDEHDGKSKTASITLYKAITTDNKSPPTENPDFELKIKNTTKTIDVPSGSTIIVDAGTYQMSETEIDGYKFVLIAGDTQCPSKIDTPFIVKGGDKIECTIYNEDDFVEGQTGGTGILFNPTHVEVTLDNGQGDNCPDPTGTSSPCAIADGGSIVVIDDEFSDAVQAEKMIVVFSIIQSPIPEILSPPQCVLEGLQDDGSGNIGFVLACSGTLDGDYAINYALINTV